MQIDIRTATIQPLRQTFGHLARRLGADKAASRYQEATFDLQPEVNFHYRPYWDPERELYDRRRTAIVLDDWYVLADPRQYYYGTYTIARARQQDGMERNFDFVDKRGLLELLSEQSRSLVLELLLPLRHVEYAANLNNCFITAYGFGTAITQAAMFCATDRLGIAQYLSRIGLLLDGNTGAALDAAKADWLAAARWQPLRELVEGLLVVEDWFELFVAQNLVLDGLLYPLAYQRAEAEIARHGGATVGMLTEFMSEWFGEHCRWVDATVKTAAAASEANHALLKQWVAQWRARSLGALAPLAAHAFGERAEGVLDELNGELQARLAKKCGL